VRFIHSSASRARALVPPTKALVLDGKGGSQRCVVAGARGAVDSTCAAMRCAQTATSPTTLPYSYIPRCSQRSPRKLVSHMGAPPLRLTGKLGSDADGAGPLSHVLDARLETCRLRPREALKAVNASCAM